MLALYVILHGPACRCHVGVGVGRLPPVSRI
jgi:hypothetical protein